MAPLIFDRLARKWRHCSHSSLAVAESVSAVWTAVHLLDLVDLV